MNSYRVAIFSDPACCGAEVRVSPLCVTSVGSDTVRGNGIATSMVMRPPSQPGWQTRAILVVDWCLEFGPEPVKIVSAKPTGCAAHVGMPAAEAIVPLSARRRRRFIERSPCSRSPRMPAIDASGLGEFFTQTAGLRCAPAIGPSTVMRRTSNAPVGKCELALSIDFSRR
jgi:hypothetical protein